MWMCLPLDWLLLLGRHLVPDYQGGNNWLVDAHCKVATQATQGHSHQKGFIAGKPWCRSNNSNLWEPLRVLYIPRLSNRIQRVINIVGFRKLMDWIFNLYNADKINLTHFYTAETDRLFRIEREWLYKIQQPCPLTVAGFRRMQFFALWRQN